MAYETAVSFGMVFTAFILIYIGTRIGADQNKRFDDIGTEPEKIQQYRNELRIAFLQMLFLVLGIFILFIHLGILGFIVEGEGETEIYNLITVVQSVVMWIGIILIGYFIIMFLSGFLRGAIRIRLSRREKKASRYR